MPPVLNSLDACKFNKELKMWVTRGKEEEARKAKEERDKPPDINKIVAEHEKFMKSLSQPGGREEKTKTICFDMLSSRNH